MIVVPENVIDKILYFHAIIKALEYDAQYTPGPSGDQGYHIQGGHTDRGNHYLRAQT
jgi:hypothetical protein